MLIHFLSSIFLASLLFEIYELINVNNIRLFQIIFDNLSKHGMDFKHAFDDYKGPFFDIHEIRTIHQLIVLHLFWSAVSFLIGLIISFSF